MISLSNGAMLTSKYTVSERITEDKVQNDNNKWKDGINNITFVGGATTYALSLSVKCPVHSNTTSISKSLQGSSFGSFSAYTFTRLFPITI